MTISHYDLVGTLFKRRKKVLCCISKGEGCKMRDTYIVITSRWWYTISLGRWPLPVSPSCAKHGKRIELTSLFFSFFSFFFFFFFFFLLFFTSDKPFFVIHSLSCSSAYIPSRCYQHPFVYSAYPLVFLPNPYHFHVLHQFHHVAGFLPVSHYFSGISMVGSRIINELSRTTSDGKPESYRCQPGERN